MNSIPYARQEIIQADIDSVVEALRSDFLTQGPVVPAFETSVANYCDVRHAVAFNSATSALHIACLALGVGKGDFVWTSPITFVASANCALYCGAEVDFVDIDACTYNMSIERLSQKLAITDKKKLPKVIILVHFCGQVSDLQGIYDLSKKYGFRIVEDASHAIGGRYCDEPIGNCRYSDITIFSFHPVKIITTGEGGMATTNDTSLARRMVLLRTHGITRDEMEMIGASDGPWYYQQIDIGYNYRMTELQAALGVSQMQRLNGNVTRRHELAKYYDVLLDRLPVTTPWQHPDSYSGLHLYVIRLQLEKIRNTRRQVFESLREQGIGVNVHYIPVHFQPYYQRLGFKAGDFPEAESYYSEAISLPMYKTLKDTQVDQVVVALRKALEK